MENILFLVEGNHQVVKTKDSIHEDNYKQKITIDFVRNLLKPYDLKMKKIFQDAYIFYPRNKSFELTIWLFSEDNFYDDKETEIKDIKVYTSLIETMDFTILKPLSEIDIELLDRIMEDFNLNIYSASTKKHYKNIEEVKKLLKCLNFL